MFKVNKGGGFVNMALIGPVKNSQNPATGPMTPGAMTPTTKSFGSQNKRDGIPVDAFENQQAVKPGMITRFGMPSGLMHPI